MKKRLGRYGSYALTVFGLLYCMFNAYFWGFGGMWALMSAYGAVMFVYAWLGFCLLVGRRPVDPAAVRRRWLRARRRPDYARIAELERQLGIGDGEAPHGG